MKLNKFVCLGILAFALFTLPVIVASSMTLPVTGGNYTTTMALSVTVDENGVHNITSVNCTYNATGGSAEIGEATSLVVITNTTADQTVFASAVSIAAFSDLATYNISCAIYNATTGGVTSLNSTLYASAITIDNTDPVVVFDVKLSGEDESFDRPLDYICGVSDAMDSSVTNTFAVAHPSGDSTTSTSLTADASDYLQFLDTDYAGDYVFTCTGTDAAGNSASETATVTINTMGRATVTKRIAKDSKTLMIVAVLVIAGLWWFNKK